MNINKLSLTFVIGLILLLSIIQLSLAASVVDVTKGSDSSYLCPRETGLFTDVVKNTDSKAREFTITTKGSASAWATSVPNGFVLLPGDQKTIYTYVTPVQDAVPSDYDLSITISTEGSNTDVEHKVTVKKCYGSTLSSDQVVQRVCPGDVAKYDMTLVNNGEYKETFALDSDGQIKDQVTLSDRYVTLEKGESKKIVAYVNSPKIDGSYSFNVKTQGQVGKSIESFNAVLNVDPCYNFAVNINGNSSYAICERTLVSIPIQLENKGTVENTFNLNVDGPQWARLDKNEITLQAGEKEYITLAVAPTYGINGDFNTTLSVVPQKGDLKASSEFDFNVRKCYSVKAEFLPSNTTVCNGLTNTFDAVVTNDGEFSREYEVQSDSPLWVTNDIPESHIFSLDAGKQQKFTFTASPSEDVNESVYPVSLNVKATDDSKSTVFSSAQANIYTLLPTECYKPSISTQFDNVTVYYDSTVTLPLIVKNEGLAKVTYDIVLSGTGANFMKLAPAVLEVEPGKSETSYLYIAPTPQLPLGQYDAIISVKIKDGSFLATRKIPIEVTDDKEKATSIGLANLPADVELQPEKQPTLWQRFVAWVKRNFSTQQSNSDTNSTEENNASSAEDQAAQLDQEVANTSVDVNSIGTEPAVTTDVNTSEGAVVVDDNQGSGFKDTINSYKYYILGGIVVLLVLIILIRIDAFKKLKGFFEEEE